MIVNSLISRVIILSIMLLSTGIGIFSLFHIHREEAHLVDVTRESARLLLSTVEKSIYTSMSIGNSEDVQAILEQVGQSNVFAHLRIFHPDGIILKSSHPEEIGTRVNSNDLELFKEEKEFAVFQVGDEGVLGMVKPIESDQRCFFCHGEGRKVIGVLNLNFSLNETMHRIQETSQYFLLSTIAIIALLSLGITYILIRFVKRPIRMMVQKMSRVEAGDLTVRMDADSRDEIGVLMRSFNSMVQNLGKARGELEQYHYRQMERADRLASVGEMASGIAHEIRNPLAGISGAITVLSDDFSEDDSRRQIVQEVLEQIKRLDKTVNDLLYFGRPGKPELAYADINNLVKTTLFFISQHPEAKNIHRIKELTRDLPAVWIDEKQIQQVLFNVILNAIQAMKEGGTLIIETDATEQAGKSYVRVRVIDTGPGIPAEELERIFVPFHTTKTQGTGLGLPICRQLLEQHGGEIEIESRSDDGTTVTILLPISLGEQKDMTREVQGA
ncbi:MAG: histidine kinase [Desulfuromonas sp.]|nr:MAG: histidine kinase [Desulfuromonas sp.]